MPNQPTRLQRWLGDRLIERGHPPLAELVENLRAQDKTWRQIAAEVTHLAGEPVTQVSLWTWFGQDGERAA